MLTDEKSLNEKIHEIETMWNNDKPSSNAEIVPKDALVLLDTLSTKINFVGEKYTRCCEAKELLGMPIANTQKLDDLKEDIELLREVWLHLQTIWQPYENIRDTLITAIHRNKIKEIETEVVR